MLSKTKQSPDPLAVHGYGEAFTFIAFVSCASNASTSPELTMYDSNGAKAAPGVIVKSAATMTVTPD